MGSLLLGAILQYMISASISCFLRGGKELKHAIKTIAETLKLLRRHSE